MPIATTILWQYLFVTGGRFQLKLISQSLFNSCGKGIHQQVPTQIILHGMENLNLPPRVSPSQALKIHLIQAQLFTVKSTRSEAIMLSQVLASI